jgi:hypothetical protein
MRNRLIPERPAVPQVGDRVRFLEDSALYAAGIRFGTVVSVTERYGDFLSRMARQIGEGFEELAAWFDEQGAGFDPEACQPIVAVDPAPHLPVPCLQFAVGPEQFAVVDPAHTPSVN